MQIVGHALVQWKTEIRSCVVADKFVPYYDSDSEQSSFDEGMFDPVPFCKPPTLPILMGTQMTPAANSSWRSSYSDGQHHWHCTVQMSDMVVKLAS